jgi:hypothetical protein
MAVVLSLVRARVWRRASVGDIGTNAHGPFPNPAHCVLDSPLRILCLLAFAEAESCGED